jgi:hypothetical protein
MVGNLVDNAGKWARHTVAINIAPEPWRNLSERLFFRVTIDDDGPGLAARPRCRGASASMKRSRDRASGFRSSPIWRRFTAAICPSKIAPEAAYARTY